MRSDAEHFAFSFDLAFLAARVEQDPVRRERLFYGVSELMAEAIRVVNRKPRRRRERSKQLPLFYPLEHQIRLKFQPLPAPGSDPAR